MISKPNSKVKLSYSRPAAPDFKEIMNEQETAQYVGRSSQTIRKLRLAGLIPCLKVPGFRSAFYSRSMLDKWITGEWTPEQNAAEN